MFGLGGVAKVIDETRKKGGLFATRPFHFVGRHAHPRSRDELIRGAAEDQWGYYVSSIIFNMNDPGDVALTEVLRSQRIIKNVMASDERRAWSIDQALLLEPSIAYCRNRCVYSRQPQFSKTLLTTARQCFEAFAGDNDA
jgi:hypothetical protein